MTKEQEKISSINQQKAWDYFVSIGEIPEGANKHEYNLHHIDPTLLHNDIERYILWLIPDLIPLTISEHSKLHWQIDKDLGRYTDRCKKISESMKDKPKSEEHRNHLSEALKGKPKSEETRRRMSECKKGDKNPMRIKYLKERGLDVEAFI